MVTRKRGRIINLASVASYTAHTDVWYGVTKAGVVSFTRSFAAQLGPHGIQVNAVAPGPIDTQLLKPRKGVRTLFAKKGPDPFSSAARSRR